VIRVSTGSITEVAYVTARDEEEAEEKLSRDELDRDFELVEDDMSVEEEHITLCKSEETGACIMTKKEEAQLVKLLRKLYGEDWQFTLAG
jgi:hypothetical protein